MATRARQAAQSIVRGLDELSAAIADGDKITERFRCRKVILNLKPVQYKPANVKATRHMLRASQSIFAQLLGVATSTVSAWEQGRCAPSDMACRFMDEMHRDPEDWRRRLSEAVSVKEPV